MSWLLSPSWISQTWEGRRSSSSKSLFGSDNNMARAKANLGFFTGQTIDELISGGYSSTDVHLESSFSITFKLKLRSTHLDVAIGELWGILSRQSACLLSTDAASGGGDSKPFDTFPRPSRLHQTEFYEANHRNSAERLMILASMKPRSLGGDLETSIMTRRGMRALIGAQCVQNPGLTWIYGCAH